MLTIGDSNYVEDKRIIVLKPRKNQEVSVINEQNEKEEERCRKRYIRYRFP